MKKIGSGYEHIVYELNKNKVIKIKNSYFNKFFKLIYWNKTFNLFKLNKSYLSLNKLNKRSINIVSSLEDKTHFGNPIILKNKIIQDRVIIINQIISKNNYKKIIDDYIKLIFLLWNQGVHELVYNFTINNGYDLNHNLIQIDFGELTNSKVKALNSINSKLWLTQFSYKFHLTKEMKIYFKRKMELNLNKENLNKYWKDS